MDHVVGPSHILLTEKEGRIRFTIICLKLYQFNITTWWCLYVLKFVLESIMESNLESTLKFVLLKKYKKITVSQNLRQAHLLEVGLTKVLGDHDTLCIVCHV